MNTKRLWFWSPALLVGLLAFRAAAAETATVKADKVNVRAQASMNSEVVTRLQRGESVVILEELDAVKPKKGDPKRWAKIQLPAGTAVWVFAPFIEPSDKFVNVNRLNLRAGPGEHYSVLGRIERGTPVKEIRTADNWMEIEPPEGAYAFVALDYLEKAAPAPPEPAPRPVAVTPTQPAPQPTVTTPPPPPTTVQTVTTEPAPAPPVDVQPREPARPVTTAPPTTATATPAAPPPTAPATVPAEPPPVTAIADNATPARRIVTREGIVIYARSVQSPTKFALESLETRRTINWLATEEVGLTLKSYAGRKVFVSGEELLDQRWKKIPILSVENIELAP